MPTSDRRLHSEAQTNEKMSAPTTSGNKKGLRKNDGAPVTSLAKISPLTKARYSSCPARGTRRELRASETGRVDGRRGGAQLHGGEPEECRAVPSGPACSSCSAASAHRASSHRRMEDACSCCSFPSSSRGPKNKRQKRASDVVLLFPGF